MELLYRLAEAFAYLMAAPPFPMWIVWLVLGAPPVILLHELGHAIAARRLLGVCVDVTVGNAGRVAERRLGELTLTLNAFDDPRRAASGLATFDGSRASARDIALIALAGPFASLLGVLVSAAAFVAAPYPGLLHDFLWATTLAGVFAVLNVVPLTIEERRGGPAFSTDGRIALLALRLARL